MTSNGHDGDRLLDIFSLIEREEHMNPPRLALCAVAAKFVGLDGASIVLLSDDNTLTSLCSSGATARSLVDREIVLGEGPTVDASRAITVNEPDLLTVPVERWTTFTPEALVLGARAVFAYSIRLGAIRFGALSLYRRQAGPLIGSQETDAFLMAAVIGRAILASEAGETIGGLIDDLMGTTVLDFTVHQAAGMVAVQGSMSVRDALVCLRANAFATNCELSGLAERVVTRVTRFDARSDTWLDGRSET